MFSQLKKHVLLYCHLDDLKNLTKQGEVISMLQPLFKQDYVYQIYLLKGNEGLQEPWEFYGKTQN